MYNVKYIAQKQTCAQGNWEDVYRTYGNQWIIRPLGGGNGNWLLQQKCDVLIDGVSYKDFVLDKYERKRLSRKLVDDFKRDLNSGKIILPKL